MIFYPPQKIIAAMNSNDRRSTNLYSSYDSRPLEIERGDGSGAPTVFSAGPYCFFPGPYCFFPVVACPWPCAYKFEMSLQGWHESTEARDDIQ